MKLTEIAAWWGAGVATIVLLWDIYKWRHSKSRIRVRATCNMILSIAPRSDKLIYVTATNVGRLNTTITHLTILQYRSRLHRLLRKHRWQGVVIAAYPQPGPLPHLLAPGADWSGGSNQVDFLEKVGGQKGYCYIGVRDAVSDRLTLTKIKISKMKG